MKENLTYAKQWIDDEDIEAVVKVLKSDFLTQGPWVAAFEQAIALRTGAKYAVAVSNGTAALHIAYMALGVKHGDTVLTTPITFAATANAALYVGAKPEFADIHKELPLIDPEKIEEQISSSTKLIVPVHYGGMVANMEKIKKIADKYNLFVVEDACHALGSKGDGWTVGSCKYSHMTVFSFHPVKHIATGEGGAITTNDKSLYDRLLRLRNHGIERENFINPPDNPRYYEIVDLGYNYRLSDIQAALGLSQMKKLDMFIEKRRLIAAFYKEKLGNLKNIKLLSEPENIFNAYHLYPILTQNRTHRNDVYQSLIGLGIQCQIHYTPVHKQPFYEGIGYKSVSAPFSEDFYARVLSIPMYPKMTIEDARYVVECMKKVDSVDCP